MVPGPQYVYLLLLGPLFACAESVPLRLPVDQFPVQARVIQHRTPLYDRPDLATGGQFALLDYGELISLRAANKPVVSNEIVSWWFETKFLGVSGWVIGDVMELPAEQTRKVLHTFEASSASAGFLNAVRTASGRSFRIEIQHDQAPLGIVVFESAQKNFTGLCESQWDGQNCTVEHVWQTTPEKTVHLRINLTGSSYRSDGLYDCVLGAEDVVLLLRGRFRAHIARCDLSSQK